MSHLHRPNIESVDAEITGGDVGHVDPPGNFIQRDGEDDRVHLIPKDRLETHIPLLRSADADQIALAKKR